MQTEVPAEVRVDRPVRPVVEVPEHVQAALAALLEKQFSLGLLAANGRRPTRQQCTPAADALAAVCEAIREALQVAAATERHACSIAVWMTLQDALDADADDKGLDGWMREAEQRVKRRA